MLLLLLQGALILKILRGKYPAVQGYSKELTDVVKACLTLVRGRDAARNISSSCCGICLMSSLATSPLPCTWQELCGTCLRAPAHSSLLCQLLNKLLRRAPN
jgi:hypothetical protein